MRSQSQVSTRQTHDVIFIGGGSAGYVAARTAGDAGADVAIVDHGPLGGSVSCVAACQQRPFCVLRKSRPS